MMPNKPVHLTLRRWQVVGAFVGVVASAAVALLVVQHYAAKTNRTARHANALAMALSHEVVARRRLAVQEFRNVQQIAQKSCTSRHKLYLTLRGILKQSQRDARREVQGPLGRVAGAREAIERGVREDSTFLHRLRGSDCRSVPPIVTSTKPKP